MVQWSDVVGQVVDLASKQPKCPQHRDMVRRLKVRTRLVIQGLEPGPVKAVPELIEQYAQTEE